ncbi:MAG: polyprenyl synthetase family protein [Myxococcota bacterium]
MSDARERVAAAMRALLPTDPDPALLGALVHGSQGSPVAEGLDSGRVQALFFDPIRCIAARGGKSWRSLLLEACCEAVGGDFTPYESLLALPELIHVGSLIVDDVQDASTVRRGGPCAHVTYGSALAVNAGTGAYFLAEHALAVAPLEVGQRDRIRGLMFEAFRGAHVGQALDLGGLDEVADAVLDGRRPPNDLVREVEVVHWLKAALPAAAFARVGCVLGNADPHELEAVGAYVEAVGMAFQAIDDVLNLRGFAGDLKERGEDLRDGKLTLPVAHGIARLPRPEARLLWASIRARPTEPSEVHALVAVLEGCGALDAVDTDAHERVSRAWGVLEATLGDRPGLATLHRLGEQLLRRHY